MYVQRRGICPVWSDFAVRMKKPVVLSYPLSAQRRLIRLGRCQVILLVLSFVFRISPFEFNLKINQRTSGPVNAPLTPGPGIYFNSLYMYIAPGQGQTTPWGQILMPYHFAHLLQILKQSLWSLILYTFFHVFPHVYSPGQGQTTD